jgi:hypothetical protein
MVEEASGSELLPTSLNFHWEFYARKIIAFHPIKGEKSLMVQRMNRIIHKQCLNMWDPTLHCQLFFK